MLRFRRILTFTAFVAALVLLAGDLSARPGGGGSFGSRGSRTFSAPPATSTAPKAAAPIERTMTQPGSTAATAGAGAASSSAGGFFNRPGLLGGLAAGFLGAGLFGMLFGNGFMGGLGSFASILGLIFQIALVVIVARLLWAWWQRRQGLATASGPALRGMNEFPGARNLGGGGAAAPSRGGAIEIKHADFDAFERLLSDISLAYGREDLAALRALATPEMLSYFSEDLAKNASRGVVNEVGGIKLLQGDLSEAWREDAAEYATVAMRYAITDVTVERASGKVVDGSRSPAEVTELWTFRRARGGKWILSAIQQT
ncbi:MAG: TIM44-like domain-containing protein [Rhizobiales bacterium]|nr:TIM44-like domain-containing protein [Hyphomicrobiales bacterium]